MAPGRKKSATASRNWAIGDLVLAKVRGYPAWPAKVSAPEKHKLSPKGSKVFVEYFGTKDFGFVQSGEVSEFTADVRSVVWQKANSLVSRRLHKRFKSAVEEICRLSDKLRGVNRDEDVEETLVDETEKRTDACVDVTDCGEVVDEGTKECDEADNELMDNFACLAMAAETVLTETEAVAAETEQREAEEEEVSLSGQQVEGKPKVVRTFERRKKGGEAKGGEVKVLKTFERRKKTVKSDDVMLRVESAPEKVEAEKIVFKRELSGKVSEPEERMASKKLKRAASNEVSESIKRSRREETLPPRKRLKALKSPPRVERENKPVKEKEQVKPKTAQPDVVKDAKVPSPVVVAAPTKLIEAETNRVREAYEAAKEMRQKLAQKEETVSASMKFLQAAAQAKKRSQSGSNRDTPLFMRPENASPSQHHHAGENPSSYSRREGSVESFVTSLETLTGTQESILKTTRHAMRCGNKGYGKKVMHIIMRKLKNEGDHRKRIDLLFLVESMTRGISGSAYARILEASLGRFLTAVAPPNSPLENHKQCLKVVNLWLKRKSMEESLLTGVIGKLEAGLNTRKRQHQRQDRAVDDPVREIDDMLVDEYGSNAIAGFQLPGLLARRLDEEDEDAAPPHHTPSSPENNRHAVILEDLDGELEMEDVSPRNDEHLTRMNNGSSTSSSLTRHDEAERRETIPLPPSPPPPLPQSPPPSSPPRPPNSPSPHSSLQHPHHS